MFIPYQTINQTRASAIESRPSAFNIKLLVVVDTIISAIPIPGNVQTEAVACLSLSNALDFSKNYCFNKTTALLSSGGSNCH